MNAVWLSDEIERRYKEYLQASFYFRDPEFRALFEQALREGYLRKGPYLEGTPVFERAELPPELFAELLGHRPDERFLAAIEPGRRLYRHQQEAAHKLHRGLNVVVATGTGSGKTEAFLYPILVHLYREFEAGTLSPGVRALVLYPMNALANDQRERLGSIAGKLQAADSPFRFSFGQYVGETPEDEADSLRNAREHVDRRFPGELVLRSEMRQRPPHILLTNYSMLEYLLLRPSDSPLFDDGCASRWTFLVLDEAHQYRGARGAEMAMLLRRLKKRLRDGGRGDLPFRCVATSATLTGSENEREAVAVFARELFGEAFAGEGVILGKTEAVPATGDAMLPPPAYGILREVLREGATHRLDEFARSLGVSIPKNGPASESVPVLLQHDARVSTLRSLITGAPREVPIVGEEVFADTPDHERAQCLSNLIESVTSAMSPTTDAPILSTRYHLFLRSLEGAFVAFWPKKSVFLERRVSTGDAAAFEVALCRECGQHYLVGPKGLDRGKLGEAARDPANPAFGATFFRPLDEEPVADEDQEGKAAHDVFLLCVRCGELDRRELPCGHGEIIRVAKEQPAKDEDRADQVLRCGACGYNAGGRDPVREVVHGTDGPNAVIATTLYKNLPEDRRKVLAFADGRQEAAFFAWYLEDSYTDILSRNVILAAARQLAAQAPEGLSIRELVSGLRSLLRERGMVAEAAGDVDVSRAAWRIGYREFLTDEPRISLAGVGLVRWSLKRPRWLSVPSIFLEPPWSLGEDEAGRVLALLVDSMRDDRAVELRVDRGVPLEWSDLELDIRQTRVVASELGKLRIGEKKWSGTTGRRALFLAKHFETLHPEASPDDRTRAAVTALRVVWDHLKRADEDAPSVDDRLLLSLAEGRRANPDWWRIRPLGPDDLVFRCESCTRLQPEPVQGLCARHGCRGRVQAYRLKDLQSNHYRTLYEEGLPRVPRVEEHTAQLDKEKAREFQRGFRTGAINVLSCSTTFELGVDLGDLDTVFLRNVPPEAFNYAQRVGRAGRRSGYPGFAVTYCKRGPHDLYHFADPDRIMKGSVRPPLLALRNEKIVGRHMTAVVLSSFFRRFPDRFKSVQAFVSDFDAPKGLIDVSEFVAAHESELRSTLRSIVPAPLHEPLGLEGSGWALRIVSPDGHLASAEAEAVSDYRNVKTFEMDSAAKGNYDAAKWARGRAATIAEEDLLSFLSRKAVIPKYGFPVDVVELDTQRNRSSRESTEVSLQRDLAIAVAEFAPTSRLVANKKEWVSYGLKKVLEREWPRKHYKRCARHNVFVEWDIGQLEPDVSCCAKMVRSEYVIPKFGFLTDRRRPEPPKGRSTRVFSTRPYFARNLGAETETLWFPEDAPVGSLRKVSRGRMVVMCEGRRGEGFYVCSNCGAGFRTRERAHSRPYGQDCRGALRQVSLGHEFETDVLHLRFLPAPPANDDLLGFAYSLAHALVEGAAEEDVLAVPSADLNATVARGSGPDVPPIVLYDTVPGGAGLVARLEDPMLLRACIAAARRRTNGDCGCDEATSCYGCLRNYRNQFMHNRLRRGSVNSYFAELLAAWPAP